MPSKIERSYKSLGKDDGISMTLAGESCRVVDGEILKEMGIVTEKQAKMVASYCHELNIRGYDGFKTLVETRENELDIKWLLSDTDLFLIGMMFGVCYLAPWSEVVGDKEEKVSLVRKYTTTVAGKMEIRSLKIKLNIDYDQAMKLHDKWNGEMLDFDTPWAS